MYTKEQIIDWCESSRLNRCYHCINYKPDDEGKCQIQTCGNDYFASTENYLKELAKFNDETPITEDWLKSKFRADKSTVLGVKYSIRVDDSKNVDIWGLETLLKPTTWKVSYYDNIMHIKTLGQLSMFLTASGLGHVAKMLNI